MLLLANASAGTHQDDTVEAVAALLDARVATTSSPEELDEVLREVTGDVVVAGGDGSLHAVVNALHRLDRLGEVRVGLVPLGTGNDFARAIGLPEDPLEAAALIVKGSTRPIDLVLDEAGTIVVNAAHLGVGAEAGRAAEAWKPRLGRLGYALGAVAAGLRPKFLHVRVTVDGRSLSRRPRVAQVAIGNGAYVGGGTELIPDAEPHDGELMVIVSRAVGPVSRVVYLARLRIGRQAVMREVESIPGEAVSVSGEPFWISADGELSGPYTHKTWHVLPGALTFFTP